MLSAGYIEDYAKSAPGPVCTRDDLARLSYWIAYHHLPSLVHERWDEFLRAWNDGIPFPMYLALFGATLKERHLTVNQVIEFAGEKGMLFEEVDFYLIQFPTPPHKSQSDPNLEQWLALPPEQRPALGPYFVVAIHDTRNGQRHFYVLGQAPSGGTTIRCVTIEEGTYRNSNCGPGPEPTAKLLLDALRQRIKSGRM